MTSPLCVIAETVAYIAVDKPAGTLSVPSRLGAADPRPCLLHQLTARYGGAQVFPVHRLDEDVSGLILFARTPDAQRTLSAAFEERRARKRYEAFTELASAHPGTEQLQWQSRLLRGKKRAYESPHGKLAITWARCVGDRLLESKRVLRFELEPRTGRSHQLRVHLATHGMPIVGDRLYGATTDFAPGGIALRSVHLEIDGLVLGAPGLVTLLEHRAG